ncbi:hypothetical protein [Pseudoalteromonas luteoviolacea]|uniref:hypothetical protein n=1 Tax=Pseudoalteromonas luteoviolacea TaxID=43657 RepID=UPI001B3817DE|nr:hypothetical protein [Pseudoalteromonas luteoviolacea]MBQ4839827.1 hypothetical protein [Pseudoalteromonas luteoviolacea]
MPSASLTLNTLRMLNDYCDVHKVNYDQAISYFLNYHSQVTDSVIIPQDSSRPFFISGFSPSSEQVYILSLLKKGSSLILDGGAGTSKTSLLSSYAQQLPSFKQGLVFVSSSSLKKMVSGRFLRNIQIITQFSFCYQFSGERYRNRIQNWLKPSDIEHICSIKSVHGVSRDKFIRSIISTLDSFCLSEDAVLSSEHVKLPLYLRKSIKNDVSSLILRYSQEYWENVCHCLNLCKVTYSMLMKLWFLSSPKLHADIIFIDNYQELHPLLLKVILAQTGQKVIVGDPLQSLKMSSLFKLNNVPGVDYIALKTTYRHTKRTVGIINYIAAHFLDTPIDLVSYESTSDLQTDLKHNPLQNAVICHNTSGLVHEIIHAINLDMSFAVLDDLEPLHQFIEGLYSIKQRGTTSHQVLRRFSTEQEVYDFIETSSGYSMREFACVTKTYSLNTLLKAIQFAIKQSKDNAAVLIGSAKATKFMEFENVRLSSDFISKEDEQFKYNDGVLIYIAATRARSELDITNCSALKSYVPF